MSVLIVYDSKTGTTKKCSELLSKKINEKCDVIEIKKIKNIDITTYTKVIIGSYVNNLKVSSKIKKFCKKNIKQLLEKKVAIFLCMGLSNEFKKVLEKNFDKKLIANLLFAETFGGIYKPEELKGFKKKVIESVLKSNEEKGIENPRINEKNINQLINIINNF